MGLSTPRSGGGGAAQGHPNQSGSARSTTATKQVTAGSPQQWFSILPTGLPTLSAEPLFKIKQLHLDCVTERHGSWQIDKLDMHYTDDTHKNLDEERSTLMG